MDFGLKGAHVSWSKPDWKVDRRKECEERPGKRQGKWLEKKYKRA